MLNLTALPLPSLTATRTLALLLLVALLRRLAGIYHRARRLSFLPGPPSNSLLVGNIVQLEGAKLGTTYPTWFAEYGCTLRIHGALNEAILLTCDPRAAHHVLNANAGNYVRSEISRLMLEMMFGKSLFSVEGDEHKRMRRTLNGAFTPQTVQDVSHVLSDLAESLKTQWLARVDADANGAAEFDITSDLHVLTLDAICATTFAHRPSTAHSSLPALLHRISNSPRRTAKQRIAEGVIKQFPVLLKLPAPVKMWGQRMRMELEGIAVRVLEERERGKEEREGMHATILDLMDKRKVKSGTAIGRDEAVAQIIGILFAGSESTANVISELLLDLARRPDAQARLRAELCAFERAHGRAPAWADVADAARMPYLDAVVREGLRLRGVLMVITRATVAADRIPLAFPVPVPGGGTQTQTHVPVEPGQVVHVAVREGVNVAPQVWGADAGAFRPERWLRGAGGEGLPAAVGMVRAQGNVLTFGDGPKVCLGRLFAIAEIKIVLATLLRALRFEDTGAPLDWYHMGGNTVKPLVRGREGEGVRLPLRVRRVGEAEGA